MGSVLIEQPTETSILDGSKIKIISRNAKKNQILKNGKTVILNSQWISPSEWPGHPLFALDFNPSANHLADPNRVLAVAFQFIVNKSVQSFTQEKLINSQFLSALNNNGCVVERIGGAPSTHSKHFKGSKKIAVFKGPEVKFNLIAEYKSQPFVSSEFELSKQMLFQHPDFFDRPPDHFVSYKYSDYEESYRPIGARKNVNSYIDRARLLLEFYSMANAQTWVKCYGFFALVPTNKPIELITNAFLKYYLKTDIKPVVRAVMNLS